MSFTSERGGGLMGKKLLGAILALALLASCAPRVPEKEDDALRVLAATYPTYLFTTALTAGIEGVRVDLLVNSQTSCLHDYTLTVNDMKAIEKADVIVMNGAGLEDFLSDALSQSDAAVIDCSAGLDLLPSLDHAGHDHDHEEEQDPHIWMDPDLACEMARNIARQLSDTLPQYAQVLQANADGFENLAAQDQGRYTGLDALSSLECRDLITFHDGFQYFAQAFGLDLLKAIEEEEGATASAAEIKEIVALIEERHIPAIFVEKNGSRATADVVARETGCRVYELDMLMSGEYPIPEGYDIDTYISVIDNNLETILEALG